MPTFDSLYKILKFRIHVSVALFLALLSRLRYFQYYQKNPIIVSLSFAFLATFIYFFNKVTDVEEDKINSKKDAIEVSYSNFILVVSIIFFILPLFYLFHNLNLFLLYILVGSIGFLYSYRIKILDIEFRLKDILLIKNMSAALIWALPIAFVPSILRSYIDTYDVINFFVVVFIVTAIEVMWDIKDIKGDRRLGIQTIPNIFGLKLTKVIACIMVLLAIILMLLYSFPYTSVAASLILLFFIIMAKESYNIMYYHSIIFVWGVLLILGLLI